MARPSLSPWPVPPHEVVWTAIRAQGAGGQNVNKVSTAVHLRFDVVSSSLPQEIKARLLALRDGRFSSAGIVVIKAQQYRTQAQNKADALARLQCLVDSVSHNPRVRRETQPSYGERQRRLQAKSQRSQTKSLRDKVRLD